MSRRRRELKLATGRRAPDINALLQWDAPRATLFLCKLAHEHTSSAPQNTPKQDKAIKKDLIILYFDTILQKQCRPSIISMDKNNVYVDYMMAYSLCVGW
ncbi:hypothetical protein OUZ56_008393 [Daphnia magna]|uniref:Uncharacterized protein n=1 Tax=Daphnia magna TaxID=35525 RepID=A0ABR0ACU3_9CRUS|nr:hypothetical protein OUZ56_008393 [Daphnia magna]